MKKEKAGMKESEALIKNINNNLKSSMIYQIIRKKDGKREFTFLSNSVKKFYGITPEQAKKDANLIYSRILKEDAEKVYFEEEKANKNLTPLKIEVRIKNPSGTIRWSSFVSYPTRLPNGETQWGGIETDITEKKKIEEELKIAKENVEKQVIERTAELEKQTSFLNSVVENVPDMIFVKEASDLKFELFNKAGEELLGQKRKNLIGKNDYDFFPKKQADFFTKKDRETLNNKKLVDIPEEPIKTPKGERFLHTKKIPILDKNGKPVYLLGISEDITERKTKEIEYKTIIETAVSGFAALNMNGKFLDVNDSYCKLLGYSRDELLKLGLRDVEANEKPEQTIEHIKKVISEGHDRFETKHRRKNGQIVDIDVSVTFSKEEGRMFCFFRDITEIKRSEEEIAKRNEELERFSKVAIGRELRMVELKKKIEELEFQLKELKEKETTEHEE